MIIPAQTLRSERPLNPFVERTNFKGLTYGVSPAGYDVRVAESRRMWPGRYTLASTVEYFRMPDDMMGIVHDKSTWARCGITVQNTVIEPGWEGYLTLEIANHGWRFRKIVAGMAIAQIIFHRLEEATVMLYEGKYQRQEAGPQRARFQ